MTENAYEYEYDLGSDLGESPLRCAPREHVTVDCGDLSLARARGVRRDADALVSLVFTDAASFASKPRPRSRMTSLARAASATASSSAAARGRGSSSSSSLGGASSAAARKVAGVRRVAAARRAAAAPGRSTLLVNAAIADPAKEAMSIRTYVLNDLSAEERVEILKRPRVDFSSILGTVAPIVDAVATRGDDAVREYTSKFDGVDLEDVVVRVSDLPDPVLEDDVRARVRRRVREHSQVPRRAERARGRGRGDDAGGAVPQSVAADRRRSVCTSPVGPRCCRPRR